MPGRRNRADRMAAAGKKESPSGMKALQEDIRLKQFRRVYLLYGEEEYLVQQNRKKLIEAVAGEGDSMNLNIHRDERLDWNAVQDEILSMPFFAPYRLVVLDDTKLFRAASKGSGKGGRGGEDEDAADPQDPEDGSGDSNLSAQVAAFLPQIPESTVVLFTERADEKKPGGQKGKVSVDRRGKLFKAVGKCGLAVEFTAPDEQMLKKWVMGKLLAHRIQITGDALDTFLSMTGSDMSHISMETEKLISFAGEGGSVRSADVEALTSEILEGKIFRMLDLISQHDRKGALELYHDLLVLKTAPAMIFAMLTKQFDRLLLAAAILEDGGYVPRVMEEMSLQRWQADRLVRQARGFSVSSLRACLEECARMQERSQSGHIDLRLGLELLILRCSVS